MNIIQELAEKYNGEYSEESTKSIVSPNGKYTFQPKQGVITIDETKISININEVGGAMFATEPFRITLHLNKPIDLEFNPNSALENLFQTKITSNQSITFIFCKHSVL